MDIAFLSVRKVLRWKEFHRGAAVGEYKYLAIVT